MSEDISDETIRKMADNLDQDLYMTEQFMTQQAHRMGVGPAAEIKVPVFPPDAPAKKKKAKGKTLAEVSLEEEERKKAVPVKGKQAGGKLKHIFPKLKHGGKINPGDENTGKFTGKVPNREKEMSRQLRQEIAWSRSDMSRQPKVKAVPVKGTGK